MNNTATSADWSELPTDASVDFFHEPLSEAEAGPKLKDYEIIVSMRERMLHLWLVLLLEVGVTVAIFTL